MEVAKSAAHVGEGFVDTLFTPPDPITAAALLSALAPPPSRKRARPGQRACREFATTGACHYGASCRFSHEAGAPVEIDARTTMRALAVQREELFVGGDAVAGGDASSAPPLDGDGGVPPSEGTRVGAMVGHSVTPLSMVARYYTRLYAPDAGGSAPPGWDVFVYLQANRVCVVGLAPAHPILRLRLSVTRVAFAPALRDAAPLTGKRKHGQVFLEACTVIATATTSDGRAWPLRAGVRSGLLELNTRLEREPWLLERKAATAGHLAVLLTQLKHVAHVTSALMGEAEYARLCAARGLPPPL